MSYDNLPSFTNLIGSVRFGDMMTPCEMVAPVLEEMEGNRRRNTKETSDFALVRTTILDAAKLIHKVFPETIFRYRHHIEAVFGDKKLADNPLGNFRVDTKRALAQWRTKSESEIREMANAIRAGDVALRSAQLQAAFDAMVLKVARFGRNGFVVGMMQCGKTGALINCLLVDAILHAIGGLKYKPMLVITEHSGLLMQMERALRLFMNLFGGLEFHPCGKSRIEKNQFRFDHLVATRAAAISKAQPTARVMTFLEHMMICSGGERDAESFIFRRVQGSHIKRLRAAFLSVRETDILLDPKVDEGHYGADGKLQRDTYDTDEGEAIFNPVCPHRMTLFTATPFVVQEDFSFDATGMRLTSPSAVYRGINYYNGSKIDPDADIQPPELETLDEVAVEIPLAEHIFAMLDDSKSFAVAHNMPEADVFDEACDALHDVIMRELGPRGPVGICVRAARRNETVKAIEAELRAKGAYDVMIFNGDTDKIVVGGKTVPMTVRDLIACSRTSTEMPFLILVTGKARMGDDFPPIVEVHADFCPESEYITTVLQGAYGRACGWNKPNTKVILGTANGNMMRAYIGAKAKLTDMPVEYQRAPHKATRLGGSSESVETLYITKELAAMNPVLAGAMEAVRDLTMRLYPKMGRTLRETSANKGRQHALFSIMGDDFWRVLSDADEQIRIFGRRFSPVLPGDNIELKIKDDTVLATQPRMDDTFTVLFRHLTPAMAAQTGESLAGADRRPACETGVTLRGQPQLTNGINLMLADETGAEIVPPPPAKIGRKGKSLRPPAQRAGRMDVYSISIPVILEATARLPVATNKAVFPNNPERLAERRRRRLEREIRAVAAKMATLAALQSDLTRLADGVSQ